MKEEYYRIQSTIVANLCIDQTAAGDLLNILFSDDIVPDSLDKFFSKYNIENLDYPCVWLISKLAARLQYEGVPKEQFPRIKGVVKKFAVENGRQLLALKGLLEVLNKVNIAVMLLNSAAMKVFYKPTKTQYFSDVDILVHSEDIKKTCLILEEQGFLLQGMFWRQGFYQKNDVRIVVHSTYLRANLLGGDLTDIWQYSLETFWQEQKVFIPCPEMMLMILLEQGLEAFCSRINNSFDSHFVLTFLDIKFFLVQTTLNWRKFIEIVKKSKLSLQVHLML